MNIDPHQTKSNALLTCQPNSEVEGSSDDEAMPALKAEDYVDYDAPVHTVPALSTGTNPASSPAVQQRIFGEKTAEQILLDQALRSIEGNNLGPLRKRQAKRGAKALPEYDIRQIDIRKFARPLEQGHNPFDKMPVRQKSPVVEGGEDEAVEIEMPALKAGKQIALDSIRAHHLKRLRKRAELSDSEADPEPNGYALRSRKVRVVEEGEAALEHNVGEGIDDPQELQSAMATIPKRSPKDPMGKRFESVRNISKKHLEKDECHVVGREKEVHQIIRMIAQPAGGKWERPLLIGPAGVGKKSIVRKAAHWISTHKCPEVLRGRQIIMIDCLALLANELTQMGRQELGVEIRKKISSAVKLNKNPVLYFRDIDKIIEEEYLKDYLQALLRTSLSCMASVSEDYGSENASKVMNMLSDYNFVPMMIEECSNDDAKLIVKQKMAKHLQGQNVEITEEGLHAAVKFSADYIKERTLPWKAMHLIGETINFLWEQNQKATGECMDAGPKPPFQGSIVIDPLSLATLMQIKTGKSAERLLATAWENLSRIEKRLNEQVVGQEAAIKVLSNRIIKYNMGLCDRSKPWGVFLFVGPTGVGKTELSKCIAKELSENEESFIRFDMGEFAESHTISRLIGAPPGYMGHESGGELCIALRKKPHSVILLDEIEKAHPDVRRLFLHVMDEGRLTEATGDKVDCTKTIIIMTSNLGAKELIAASERHQLNEGSVLECIQKILERELSPEFCGRVTVVPFNGLQKDKCPSVIEVHLNRLAKRLAEDPGLTLRWDDSIIKTFLKVDYDTRYGMRALCKHVEDTVLGALSEAAILQKQGLKGEISLKAQRDKIAVKFNG